MSQDAKYVLSLSISAVTVYGGLDLLWCVSGATLALLVALWGLLDREERT